ncbi:beta-2 adrenergic receptor-like [Stylophora pistillata]|uniref:beta-2 adrenergic receptor-like n=1 Tax=Stylophora pistillata TaxID=50429 RepID=UPI000C053018|nr:beta-2 adrenergic receptor-like [Stylophora pistillata]XP_022789551.1 beta-2 adrenergic receptor-like [Stylophora pistillata]XP_022789552.1 beta-2 adrenergic receptor-like [Stylophora pistillata]XP_022789553.1 beta-2 adrenergic receptor-like [Stylophora pistillata]XP_022789554.1 beta-2 adrenergic receptor-like [Stylophora pistillata]XP_022789555.1 beta-2 adrenergic receptor-like [Stylophora pistillata]XP_022789556.1 beta-2 adrenergic receptor-like [Stylophora pistillata]
MANLNEDGNNVTSGPEIFCTSGLGAAQRIFISAINLPLSIAAIIGNFLIIVALRKVSRVHPPSKLLLGCLACTDLGVGLLVQPLYIVYFMSPEHSKGCYYSRVLFISISWILCGVSLSTMTAISVDRLLALLLGLTYRQVVTVRRVMALVATFWVLYIPLAPVSFYRLYSSYIISFQYTTVDIRITMGIIYAMILLCILISTFCYTTIYRTLRLSQAQVQGQGDQAQKNEGGNQLNKARYRKTVSTALWVQMTLLTCYLPDSLLGGFISMSEIKTPLLYFAWSLTGSLLFFNSTLNPLLYCWRMREIKRAVKHTIRQFCYFPNEET